MEWRVLEHIMIIEGLQRMPSVLLRLIFMIFNYTCASVSAWRYAHRNAGAHGGRRIA